MANQDMDFNEWLQRSERKKLIDMFSEICDKSVRISNNELLVNLRHIREIFDRHGMSHIGE